MRKLLVLALAGMMSLTVFAQQAHPILALGSPAPNFELPGVDGKIHKLSDYAEQQDSGGGVYVRPLPHRADVRTANPEAV